MDRLDVAVSGPRYGQTLRLRILIVLSVLLCWGCAPVVQKPAASASTMRLTDDSFIASDGAALPLSQWQPSGSARAVMIAVHGFNDYRFAFALPGPHFARHGIALYAYDQRGFGQAPQRGIWPGETLMIRDLYEIIETARRRHPGVPIFVLGDSMGSAVVIRAFSSAGAPEVAGVILNAPAVWGEDTFNPLYRGMLWIMAHVVPGWAVTGESVRVKVSDNIDLLRVMSRDPNMIRETRFDSLYGLVHLMDGALRTATDLAPSTLVLYGLKDEVIPLNSVCRLIGRLPDGAQVAFYENGYHLLLRDRQAARVWDDVVRWIDAAASVSTDALVAKTCPA